MGRKLSRTVIAAGVTYPAGTPESAEMLERVPNPRAWEGEAATVFDPSEHTAAEVVEYLQSADDDERVRVLTVEEDGKGRKTIADWAPAE